MHITFICHRTSFREKVEGRAFPYRITREGYKCVKDHCWKCGAYTSHFPA